GAGVPLLAVALAGDAVIDRVRALRDRARGMRIGGGAVLIAMTLAIGLNLTDGLQQDVPGYTSALQNGVEGGKSVQSQLHSLTGGGSASLMSCTTSATLPNCFPAPNFQGIAAWINTPGGAPLTIKSLRGKVVLVDFWTYSCINCQRSLPHVEAWYQLYGTDGLVVVGVHTPEFAFEHVVSNVQSAVQQFGVTYPVAVDNNYSTWNAYDNEYWPADYLIDASGEVRYEAFGEGQYGETETAIRQLLADANPAVKLPPATNVPDLTPSGIMSSETYLGYSRLQYLVGATPVEDAAATYTFPSSIGPGEYGLSGTWTIGSEECTAGADARLELEFQADDVYLVLGGSGTLSLTLNGTAAGTIDVSGVPRLYTLVSGSSQQSGLLVLTVSPGVEAYDFTFG
ncbi:MAG: thioredoxin family protein, partial [Candidatus Dormibacteria bacterium]